MKNRTMPWTRRLNSLLCVVLPVWGLIALGVSSCPVYSSGNTCVTVADRIHAVYDTQMDLIRRGYPSRSSRIALHSTLYAIQDKVMQECPGLAMGNLCASTFAEHFVVSLYGSGWNLAAAEVELQTALSSFGDVHFLSASMFPPSTIQPLAVELTTIAASNLAAIDFELSVNTGSASIQGLSEPFTSIAGLQDPHQDEACVESARFGASADCMLGFDYTASILQMAVESILRGGSVPDVWQTVLHHVAFAFNLVRCNRAILNDVCIPTGFLQHYVMVQSRLVIAAAELQASDLPVITSAQFKEVFSLHIGVLSSYASWGHISPAQQDEIVRIAETALYSPAVSPGVRMSVLDPVNRTTENSIIASEHQTVQCNYPFKYWPHEAAVSPTPNPLPESYGNRKCCSKICVGAYEFMNLHEDLTTQCCDRCNAQSCKFQASAEDVVQAQTTLVTSVYPFAGYVAEPVCILI